jgi:hypothetical protein
LKVESTQLEFDKEDIEEKSTMNPLYEDDIENELQQNNNIQTKFIYEQIEIEYLLCITSTKMYVIEITKHLETIE